ncbi:MAG: hypothetical protein RL375_118 [Pseudomonadota bacterium]
MKAQQFDTLVWVFIYGGMLIAALALFVDEMLAAPLALAGGVAVCLGALGIWWRSRMDGEP